MPQSPKPWARTAYANQKTPSTEADQLKRARGEQRWNALERKMKEHGLTPSDVARMAGLSNANSIYNLSKGRSSSLSIATMEKIARVIPNTSLEDLIGLPSKGSKDGLLSNETLPFGFPVLMYEVAAGVWRQSAVIQTAHRIALPVPRALPRKTVGAVVSGPGTELVYPQGTLLFVTPISELAEKPQTGSFVLVDREIDKMHEVTIQQLVTKDDTTWLWPRSSEPQFQVPFELPASLRTHKHRNTAGREETVRILGAVVASWQDSPKARN